MFNNKIIFISGGTGSFGNKFVEIVSKKYKPKKIIIFSRDEFKQFEMQTKFPTHKYPFLRFFLGDVRDPERLKSAMSNVDYVVHAAALKQVPSAEYNPIEFVKTNIYGAENIIRASIDCGVKKVLALSTDKAANPINLYGATKFASDKIFLTANNIVGKQNTFFSVVRYGNVLGSRGSVVPYFKKFLNTNNFLPITHKSMTRFWITLDQSVNFVINSFRRMSGGELYIPKIPSVKITDLAKAMAPKVKHKIVGIRPGEKIHEIMCPNETAHLTYEFKDHYLINQSINNEKNKKIKNKIGETGIKVKNSFEYNSGQNNFLSLKQIIRLNKSLDN
jgi:UDP-N-acetylglucosamine 4,6-dehydratase/5-epimerase